MLTVNYNKSDAAERALIGSILSEPSLINDVVDIVAPSDMYSTLHADIYQAAIDAYRSGAKVDAVIIRDNLIDRYSEEDIQRYFVDCISEAHDISNATEYARLVWKHATLRRIREIGETLQLEATNPNDWKRIVSETEAKLKGIEDSDSKSDIFGGEAWLTKFLHEERSVIADPESAYCRTGISDLDEMLGGGMANGGLYIIGARPSVGKTTTSINIAENIASRGGKILFVSLEMSDRQIMCKRISNECGLPYQNILSGRLYSGDIKLMEECAKEISKRKFYMNARTGMTVSDIDMMIRRAGYPDCVIIDYLGLIKPAKASFSRYESYTQISGELKQLALKIGKPILCLSQLNRANTGRENKRPQLSDLRDTGAVEQDADGVILLHREDYYDQSKPNGEIELIVAKNRHGNVGTVPLRWEARTGRINGMPKKENKMQRTYEVPF